MSSLELQPILDCCRSSDIGKLLPDALYVHVSALPALDPILRDYEHQARQRVGELENITLVKFHLDQPKISYLVYPDFDADPHPALQSSLQVDLNTGQVNQRDYADVVNPPILHRKETFVTADYPLYLQFAQLTQQEQRAGLLSQPRAIGTLQAWRQRLAERGISIEDHQVIQSGSGQPSKNGHLPKIDRHKAAIVRNALSKPVRAAVEAGLFTEGTTFFDYGCGHGGDHQRLAQQGFISEGWDPYYRPESPRTSAEIVNLGYIINVIEDQAERRQALVNAWELTQRVLIVAAQVLVDDAVRGQIAYEDGIITRRNTFQKYYEQEELKAYIDQVLEVDSIPVALGIYFVFRDEAQAQAFRASRFRSRATTPRVQKQVKRFEDYRELLTPLMDFVTDRGRMPVKGELSTEADITAEFGTLHRAFQVILQVTDHQEWHDIAEKRRQDLLVYLALTQFGHRPKLKGLPSEVQQDILSLFGSYRQALIQADDMLLSLGDRETIHTCCQASSVGKRGAKSLILHVSALSALDPLLRLYEGCASRTIGRPEEATLVKFHARQPKLTYLFVPEFDSEPHPAIHTRMEIDLRDLHVRYQDYNPQENPPILHRKDFMVLRDYPYYAKFAKLTRQEEDWGLLDDPEVLKRKRSWQKHLEERCADLQGHRVIWRKAADPYKLKVMRSQVRARQKERSSANGSGDQTS